MSGMLRVATFNLENFDDKPDQTPTLAERIAVMRPQLLRVNADVLCLQEVNAQETRPAARELSALAELIKGTQYETYQSAHTVTQQNKPYDERNLVVLSRFPITSRQQVWHKYVAKLQYRKATAIPPEQVKDVDWERPIFHVTLDIGSDRVLHVLVLHLKSRIPSDIPGQKIDNYTWRSSPGWAEGYFLSSMKRVGQALETRILIDNIFDAAATANQEPLIVVGGDCNADFDEVTVTAIRGPVEETGNPALGMRVMVPCELTVPEPSRFSLLYLGKGVMYDHILVSRALVAYYRGAEIHNEILPDESGAFRTDVKFPESDHAPVVAVFDLP